MRSALATFLIVIAALSVYRVYENLDYGERTNGPVEDTRITLLVAGDVMLGRTVNIRSLEQNNPVYPFEKVSGRLSEADIVFINLESPIVENCPKINSGFRFCADPRMVEGLKNAGVDVVSLANNHINNFGAKGVGDTKKYLADAGIKWVGLGNLEIIERNGLRFGFLGFEWVDKGPTESDLLLIKESNSKVDVLIVAPHWGWEYQANANKNQRAWAKLVLDQGADIIAGGHPHWVQDDEKIDGKPVYYSLGNFVFDQMWSENTRKGLAVEFVFENREIVSETKIPVYIKEWAQPVWVEE